MTQIDPRFRQMGSSARRRRRRGRALRWSFGAILLGALGWQFLVPQVQKMLEQRELDKSLVQVESQFDIAPVVRVDTFTNIPGDPLIIPLPDDGKSRDVAQEPAPLAIASAYDGAAPSGMLSVLKSELVPRNRQLVATLPSTREEFALFQAERGRARVMNASLSTETNTIVPEDQLATSSLAYLRDGDLRSSLWREMVVEATQPISLDDLLTQNGFPRADAERLGARIRDQLSLKETIPAGALLALRYRIRGESRQVIQLSLYNREGFVGALAMSSAGQLVFAADAWADQPLLKDVIEGKDDDDSAGQQRLLDLIYSAALRNDIPTEVIGEALALMAKVHDLDSYADEKDRLTLIYSPGLEGGQLGRVMFIGVSGPGGERACYIVPADDDGFECFAPGSRVAVRSGGISLTPPVSGVLSQRFVPPLDGNDSKGQVVWSAPEGSTVVAVGEGQVTKASATKKDGAELEITHANGLVSKYSGMASLSTAIAQGGAIARGTVIGTVGSGGAGDQETGLTFQLTENGKPVDPMPYLSSAGEVLASNAVESLIGRIITVESAGNSRAKNPLSTASGLGQFIESTWLRMMRSYRPDLVASLSRAELLDLRFDPDLSRQMVRHLAQENEAYLRSRGHSISAGRLYLAHFLGPAGADMVLRADSVSSVGSVMGAGVVSANPFLRSYSIADLRNWADRKMTDSGATRSYTVPAEDQLSQELKKYVSALDSIRVAEKK